MTLSIIIVSYNTERILANCLSSIYTNNKDIKPEVIVVDNASKDNSVKMVKEQFPQVKLIKNKKNLFYSKANNQGLNQITGNYFLILGSDTIVPKGSLSKMIAFMKKVKDCGIVSCRELDENGETIITCHAFSTPLTQILEMPLFYHFMKNNKVLSEFRYKDWDRKDIRAVDTIPGSFMLGRREVLQAVGGFDEKLPLFYSDADFCKRAKDKGFGIYHNGNVAIVHLKAASLKFFSFTKVMQFAYRDMIYYHKKHFGIIPVIPLWILAKLHLAYYLLKEKLYS